MEERTRIEMKPQTQPQQTITNYQGFLRGKQQFASGSGFKPIWMPDFLFDFQKILVDWSLRRGRAAIFADCGLGKTPISLVWAQNVFRHTGLPVLILTPLSVSHQFVREGEKFGLVVRKSNGRVIGKPITVTNYEQLHHFKSSDFGGVVCDESSILKNFSGKTRKTITEFLRTVEYRLLCTATAAPNDFIEFGTSSEALGELGYIDILARFFKHDTGSSHPNHGMFSRGHWRFRGHAEQEFWRWLCSWSRAIRKPSDLGCDDTNFSLPPLHFRQHVVNALTKADGMLFDLPAHSLHEQRDERRRTVQERCEKAAEVANREKKSVVVWCNLNDESKLLADLISDSKEVVGSDSDEKKENAFQDFESGNLRVMVTKPTIAGFGLNWQHCAHQTFFPSHSFEQFYQAIRRSWRFGQTNPVTVDVITSEGEARVLSNLQRKQVAAEKAFSRLVELMNDSISIERTTNFQQNEEIPSWL